jgi:TnpA family transposase
MQHLLAKNWDGFLRAMASIYLGVVPAEQVFRKLDAYDSQSEFYKVMHEVGCRGNTCIFQPRWNNCAQTDNNTLHLHSDMEIAEQWGWDI